MKYIAAKKLQDAAKEQIEDIFISLMEDAVLPASIGATLGEVQVEGRIYRFRLVVEAVA